MTEREKDVCIAKAMGLNVQPFVYFWDGKNLDWHQANEEDLKDSHWTVMEYIVSDGNLKPLPDYGSFEGSWLILDYMRENPKSEFVLEFVDALYDLLKIDHGYDNYCDCMEQVFTRMTPSLIKEAAYQVAKEMIA